jgi:hypothetical protein
MRHLAYNDRYTVIPTDSSLLTITLYSSVITTQSIQSLSRRYKRVRLYKAMSSFRIQGEHEVFP